MSAYVRSFFFLENEVDLNNFRQVSTYVFVSNVSAITSWGPFLINPAYMECVKRMELDKIIKICILLIH